MKKSKDTRRRIILIGYSPASGGLKNLQDTLQEMAPDYRILRVRKDSERYKQRASDVIITWGNIGPSQYETEMEYQAKKIACNKLKTFQVFKDKNVNHPDWTTDPAVAAGWCIAEGKTVVARTILDGHSGEGIVLLGPDNYHSEAPVSCPLYVIYKKKKHEFRVHVFNNQVIDIVQKKRKADAESVNNQIRNHQNGWVYCREDITIPAGVTDLALQAVQALGLKHGAVDIIYNEKEDKCYCLEVNTAPGIEGTTCVAYSTAILQGMK